MKTHTDPLCPAYVEEEETSYTSWANVPLFTPTSRYSLGQVLHSDDLLCHDICHVGPSTLLRFARGSKRFLNRCLIGDVHCANAEDGFSTGQG